jgi:lipid-A-disaccharide synthase-like uncharacterized protein
VPSPLAHRSPYRPPAAGLRPVEAAALVAVLTLALLSLAPSPTAVAAQGPAPADEPDTATRALPLKIVPAGVDEVHLMPAPGEEGAGEPLYVYRVEYRDGHIETLSPEAFAELLYTEYYGRNRLFALLNITAPIGVAWVALGLLGQVLFTGRMLVQWLTSERNRRSVVPVAFWWMSLGGASMLIAYFIWRKDIVGVLGQATGWLIYVRNLRLIYRSAATATAEGKANAASAG